MRSLRSGARLRHMKRGLRALGLLFAACLAACNNFQVLPFESFDAAMSRAHDAPADPPMYRESAPPADLPGFVIYAQVNGDFHGGSEGSHLRAFAAEVRERKLAPDFMLYANRGVANVGTVTQHVGFGIYSSSPVYRPQGTVWCCRLAPSSIGMAYDANQMVTEVEDWARSSGIQEGDTLISLAGATVKPPNQERVAAWATKRLQVLPGDDVRAIWIRPGVGRMEGAIKAVPPRPMTGAASIVPEPVVEDRDPNHWNR